jgi:hypothetical protein
VTVQVPVPLVIVIEAELFPPPEHAPEDAITTAFPEVPPVAATLNDCPNVALAGAAVVTLMAWFSLFMLNAFDVAVVRAGAGNADEAISV